MKWLSYGIAAATLAILLALAVTHSLDWRAIGTNAFVGGSWALVTVTVVRWATNQEQKSFVHSLSFAAIARADMFAVRAAILLLRGEPHGAMWPHQGIWKTVQRQVQRIRELYSMALPGDALVLLERVDVAVATMVAVSEREPSQQAQAIAYLLSTTTRFADECLPKQGSIKHWTKEGKQARSQLMARFNLEPER